MHYEFVDASLLKRRIELGEVSFDSRSGRYFVDISHETPNITSAENYVLNNWKSAGIIEHIWGTGAVFAVKIKSVESFGKDILPMRYEFPDWMIKGAKVQLNPDGVREEWTLAWMGTIGVIERIDETLQSPVVVSFEGDAAWHHFYPDELMQAVDKIPAPNVPEYVKITRAEYEDLKDKAWRYEQNRK
jgi:hypothetical protein